MRTLSSWSGLAALALLTARRGSSAASPPPKIFALMFMPYSVTRVGDAYRPRMVTDSCTVFRGVIRDADGRKGKVGGFPPSASRKRELTLKLTRIIHVEFDRARRGLPAHHLFPFQVHVGVDLVVAEHVALGQEAAVVGEADQRLAQRPADGRNIDQLLRRQVIEVLVHRVARMDAVLNAVEPGHEQRRISEIGIGE